MPYLTESTAMQRPTERREVLARLRALAESGKTIVGAGAGWSLFPEWRFMYSDGTHQALACLQNASRKAERT